MRIARSLVVTVLAASSACGTDAPPPVVAATPSPPPAAAPSRDLPPALPPALPATPGVVETVRRVGRDTLGALLARSPTTPTEQADVLAALGKVLDARRLRPADMVSVRTENGAFTRLLIQRYEDGVPQRVTVERTADGMAASAEMPEVRTVEARVAGIVQSTLYDSMLAVKEGPALINAFVETLGSTVDFYREVQNGDGFRLVVEKRYAGDRFVGYGRVLAAEYRQSTRVLRAFHHVSRDGLAGYYDERGRSMQTGFLKTPMEFTRITSRFGMRFHPVLHTQKAHNGVDYGAPRGTPVWAVADGRVVTAAYQGACGNAVMIQHANGILTGYCHLSRFGASIREGTRVTQKQVIGYVGNTGRSTAPHLHFLVKRHGDYVNPQKVDLPRRPGLAGAELERFRPAAQAWSAELDAIPAA